MKKICHIITIVIFVFLFGLATFLVGPQLAGYTPYIIGGQGMGEVLPSGGIAYTKTFHRNDNIEQVLQPGDLMSFYQSREKGIISTRRVHLINSQKKLVYTRGEGKGVVDNKSVLFGDVIGTVSFTVEKLGRVVKFFKSKMGVVFICLLLMTLIVTIFLPEIFDLEEELEDDTMEITPDYTKTLHEEAHDA